MRPCVCPVQSTERPLREKVLERLWGLVNRTLFRWSPWFMRRYRVALLKFFGAKVDWRSSVARTALIDSPWNLTMAPYASLGEGAWLQCYLPITIGLYSCVGAEVCLLTGSHDITSPTFRFQGAPITLEANVWIASRALVKSGVTLHQGAVVALGAVVVKDVAAWTVVGGNPARVLKQRVIRDEV